MSARTNFLRTLLITRARRPATVRLDRSHPDARQETYTWRHPHGRSARGVRAWEPATATRRGTAYASPETSGPPATRGPPAWPRSPSLLSRAPSARLARPHVTGGSARPPVAFARQIRSADEVPPRRPIPLLFGSRSGRVRILICRGNISSRRIDAEQRYLRVPVPAAWLTEPPMQASRIIVTSCEPQNLMGGILKARRQVHVRIHLLFAF